ncbi:MAG: hypothetical protein Q7J86_10575 [Bacteroidota bacterium]|nr:hypothetical protein [Bacteroidota bacterium]
MAYNPKIHHRRSIRLKGYDYSQAGLYFITICVQNRVCMFGEIVDGEQIDSPQEMILNDAGKMVENWYHELENKYPDIKCHEYVVMPNHFHCIIANNGNGNQNIKKKPVGADLRVCPDHAGNTGMNNTGKTGSGEPVLGDTHYTGSGENALGDTGKTGSGEPVLGDTHYTGSGEPVLGDTHRFAPTECRSMVQNYVDKRIHTWGKNIGMATVLQKIMATRLLGTHYS